MEYTLNVKVIADSDDCFPGMLVELIENLKRENQKGTITKNDGDRMEWSVKVKV